MTQEINSNIKKRSNKHVVLEMSWVFDSDRWPKRGPWDTHTRLLGFILLELTCIKPRCCSAVWTHPGTRAGRKKDLFEFHKFHSPSRLWTRGTIPSWLKTSKSPSDKNEKKKTRTIIVPTLNRSHRPQVVSSGFWSRDRISISTRGMLRPSMWLAEDLRQFYTHFKNKYACVQSNTKISNCKICLILTEAGQKLMKIP